MHRLITAVWFLQGVSLLLLCFCICFFPEWVAGVQPDAVPTDGLVLLIASLQMTAAPLAALGFTSIYGAMRSDRVVRRRFARALALGFGGYMLILTGVPEFDVSLLPAATQPLIANLQSHIAPPDFGPTSPLQLSFMHEGQSVREAPFWLFAAFALLVAIWPVGRRAGRSLSGRADTKPQFLWAAWLGQGLSLVTFGVLLFFFGQSIFDPHSILFMVEDPRPFDSEFGYLYIDPQDAQLRDGAAFLLTRSSTLWAATGLITWIGMHETNRSEWRGFRNLHMFWTVGWVVSLGLAWDGAVLSWTFLLPGLLAIAIFQLNKKAAPPTGDFPPEFQMDPPDGWNLVDMVSGPLIALRVLLGRRRGTHALGVAAKGRWLPAKRDPNAPEHDYFFRASWKRPEEETPHNEFGDTIDVRMRFANVTFKDDAGMDVRGCALRIQAPGERPLDLLVNTGSCGPIDNVKEFGLLVLSKAFPRWVVRKAVQKNRRGREGGISGLRRAPSSYSNLHYYSQATRYWLTPEDERLLVRYRIVPAEMVEESGLLDEQDQLTSWERDRRPDETRPRDYLRREIRQRLETTTIRMRLEAQFHRPEDGETLAWYNGMYDWPPDEHPWFPLGVAELSEALSASETERLRFSPVNHPPSLGVPVAKSWLDPRSPADSERRVIERTAKLRTDLYRMFGLPGPETGVAP